MAENGQNTNQDLFGGQDQGQQGYWWDIDKQDWERGGGHDFQSASGWTGDWGQAAWGQGLSEAVAFPSAAAEDAASKYFGQLYDLTDTLGSDLIDKSKLIGMVTEQVNQQAIDAAQFGYKGSLAQISLDEARARGSATSSLIGSGLMTNTGGLDALTSVGIQYTTQRMRAAENYGQHLTQTIFRTGDRAIDAARFMFGVESGVADKKLAAYGAYVSAAYGLHDRVQNYAMGKAFGIQPTPDQGMDWGSLIGQGIGSLIGGPMGGMAGDILGGLLDF